jgi:peptidoglycan/LPS O-acetylase OafA/YrhL
MNNSSSISSPTQAARKHLLFLDGLRGLAALYVVACHALAQITENYPPAEVSPAFLLATRWLIFGQASVDIFIVLSGFCLMFPVVQHDGRLRGGVLEFVKRRSRRILPPYYAAIMLSLLLIWRVPALSHTTNALWAGALPVFSMPVLLSHLFLVHNLSDNWIYKIGYPLWSVATEWQIYFVFALLLLPIWRRYGIVAAICAGFFLGYLPRLLFHHRFDAACFRFIGLFALGMGAAVVAFSQDAAYQKIAGSPFWIRLSAGAALLFVALAALRTDWLMRNLSIHELLIGTATAAFLLVAAQLPAGSEPSAGAGPGRSAAASFVRFLEQRPVVALGTFSYSLYLIHAPFLALVYAAVMRLHLQAAVCFLVCETIALPLCIGCAYAFHLVFERPFMSRSGVKNEQEAEIAAVVSPAP